MTRWLRLGGWAALALVLLWIVFEVVTTILGFLSWVIGTIITLVIVGVVLSIGYLVLSRVLRSGESDAPTARI